MEICILKCISTSRRAKNDSTMNDDVFKISNFPQNYRTCNPQTKNSLILIHLFTLLNRQVAIYCIPPSQIFVLEHVKVRDSKHCIKYLANESNEILLINQINSICCKLQLSESNRKQLKRLLAVSCEETITLCSYLAASQ